MKISIIGYKWNLSNVVQTLADNCCLFFVCKFCLYSFDCLIVFRSKNHHSTIHIFFTLSLSEQLGMRGILNEQLLDYAILRNDQYYNEIQWYVFRHLNQILHQIDHSESSISGHKWCCIIWFQWLRIIITCSMNIAETVLQVKPKMKKRFHKYKTRDLSIKVFNCRFISKCTLCTSRYRSESSEGITV